MRVLIRLAGEITVKSKVVRKQFCTRLLKNIKDALYFHHIPADLELTWERIYLQTHDDQSPDFLKNIYGIQSYSPIEHECPSDMPQMLETVVKFYKDKVKGKTFSIKARRHGKHSFTSMDIQKELGSALNRYAHSVDLVNPDVCVRVEVKNDQCFFYSRVIKGPGGMPLVSGGHAVSLLSGGFDSPVASWMIQKRGVSMDFIFCNIGGLAQERSVVRIAKELTDRWSHGSRPRLHVVDFTDVVREIRSSCRSQYSQIILKRMFYRVAEQIATSSGADAIVTGEAIGQVSSQTLVNLKVIDQVASIPVMRPLIGFNKEDIIQMSRDIGTYEISATVQEFCQISQHKPATAAKKELVELSEEKLDLSILEKAVAERKIVNLRTVSDSELVLPYIFQDSIEDDCLVIDCRPQADYERSHYPGAIHMEFYDLMSSYKTFSRQKKIIIYCGIGMQSSQIAEKMQRDGYLAYSLTGGAKSILG